MQVVSQKVKARLSSLLWTAAPERPKDWKKQIDSIMLRYRASMGRELNLFNPARFSEKMQWRKLFEASRLFTQLSDKIAVRDYIAANGYSSILIPQLWTGRDPKSIPFDALPRPFIIKSSHGCGQAIIVKQGQGIDPYQIMTQAKKWLASCQGTVELEPGYLDVPPRIVIEPLLLCSSGHPPTELKIFVFSGIARYVQYVVLEQDRNQSFAFADRNWQRYPWRGRFNLPSLPEKPLLLDQALAAAEKLCKKMDHCRVDFYLVDSRLYIGEMTLYSYSGIITLQPEDADVKMGHYWTIKWPKTRAFWAIMTRNWGRRHDVDRAAPAPDVAQRTVLARGASELHLVADETIVAPHLAGRNELHFLVPAGVSELRLVSPNFRAAGADMRRLSVIVGSLAVSDGAGWREIPLDAPGLFAGFHEVERNEGGAWRWTDGEAYLSPALWADLSGPVLLRLTGVFTGLAPEELHPSDEQSAT